jgi:heme/copper-type cytochrome/quinol oxidase subunit 2
LALLAYSALHLLRLGMTAGELSEAARQRLAGLGMLLLYVVVLVALGVTGVGVYCLFRVFKIA